MDYKFGLRIINSQHPEFMNELGTAYSAGLRPLCLCREPGNEMYICKVNDKYVLKRMPGTAEFHSDECTSYDTYHDDSALGELLEGGAINEHQDNGTTLLKFDFRLNPLEDKKAAPQSDGEKSSVRDDGKKLTLRAALHYLWTQAGYSVWPPRDGSKRYWDKIRAEILVIAQKKKSSTASLEELLYLPPAFSKDEDVETVSVSERKRFFATTRGKNVLPKHLKILIGPVKEIAASHGDYVMTMLHMHGEKFLISSTLYKRLDKYFSRELSLWKANEGKLITIATVGLTNSGVFHVDEISLMTITNEWIPYETNEEYQLLASLVARKRVFSKPLRYNRKSERPIESAVLVDTGSEPFPLYIFHPPVDEKGLTLQSLYDFIGSHDSRSPADSWVWNTGDAGIPTLPPRASSQTLLIEGEKPKVPFDTNKQRSQKVS